MLLGVDAGIVPGNCDEFRQTCDVCTSQESQLEAEIAGHTNERQLTDINWADRNTEGGGQG